MRSLIYTLTRGDDDIDIDVEYSLSKFYPATGPSWSSPGEPAEGGDVEDISITLDGKPFELTPVEAEQVEAHILMMHEDDGDYYEAAE